MSAPKLSVLRRMRTLERGHLENAAKTAAQFRSAVPANKNEVVELLHVVEMRLDKVQDLDTKIVNHQDLPDDDTESELISSDEHSTAATECIALLKRLVSEVYCAPNQPQQQPTLLTSSSATASSTPFVRQQESSTVVVASSSLALDTMPEAFNGDRLRYRAFRAQFDNWIGRRTAASDTDRLVALLKLLRAEPKSLIESLTICDSNYKVALKLLDTNFGQISIERHQILASLLSLPSVKSASDLTGLRQLLNRVQSGIMAMDGLGHPLQSYALCFDAALRAAVPSKLLFEFTENKRLTAVARAAVIISPRADTPPVSSDGGSDVSSGGANGTTDATVEAADNIHELIDFLTRYSAHREETSMLDNHDKADTQAKYSGNQNRSNQHNKKPTKYNKRIQATVAASVSQPHRRFKKCLFCSDESHSSSRCAAPLSLDQRHKTLDKQKRCRICFRERHVSAGDCSGPAVPCRICNSTGHYTSMHPSAATAAPHDVVVAATHAEAAALGGDTLVFTASAYMIHGNKRTPIRLFLDQGSTLSFVHPRLLPLMPGVTPVHRADLNIKTFAGQHCTVRSPRYRIQLASTHGDERIDIFAYQHTFDVDPSVVCSPAIKEVLQQFNEDHRLADRALLGELPAEAPSVLIGIDQYFKIAYLGREKVVMDSIIAKETRLGWIVGGPTVSAHITAEVATVQAHCCVASLTKPARDVERLWSLEAIGVNDTSHRQLMQEEEEALQQFDNGLKYDGCRYTVSVPKRASIDSLINNMSVALNRLRSKLRSIQQKPDMYDRYHTEIMSFVNEGHAEEVADCCLEAPDCTDGTYYMPHHQVVTQADGREKWRIVFDCSASAPLQSSLNDHLLTGPNLNPDLIKLLLNFRLHGVALSADITRAYMRINIDTADQPFFRFLWQGPDDTQVRCFQMKKVTWGAAPSGFLLAATLRELLKRVDPQSDYSAGDSLYHDDLLRSFPSDKEAITFAGHLIEWLGTASMELAKWKSNSPAVAAYLRGVGVESPTLNFDSDTVLKVLGIAWSPSDDQFRFLLSNLVKQAQTLQRVTKRSVLRIVAAIFDPVGWLLPYVLRGKLIIQKLWSQTLKWDDPVTGDQLDEFNSWVSEMQSLLDLRIDRQYGDNDKRVAEHHLHIFGDASEAAYAAAAYLQTHYEDGSSCCRLVMAKSRLAPRDRPTLPRLELLAALLVVRLRRFITEKMQMTFDQAFLYTDSTVTYYWCTAEQPSRWKPFVYNRVVEIQKQSQPSEWYLVPGRNNVADFATRGVAATELVSNSQWWKGPEWLGLPSSDRPLSQPRLDSSPSVEQELRVTAAAVIVTDPLIDLNRHSSFNKAIRVMANVLRFFYKSRKLVPPSEAELLKESELRVTKCTQQQYLKDELQSVSAGAGKAPSGSKLSGFTLFLDEDGLLRARTRLTLGPHFSYDEKNPIVVPGESRLAALLIIQHHRTNAHFGVNTILSALRRRYWVTRARQIIKTILNKCVICRRSHARAADQVRAPLPPERITLLSPFSTTGIDFCGPFYTRNGEGTVKAYIALFTCATTRAVHLELVPSMNTPQTHLAIRRFLSSYPACQLIISDNGRSFVRAASDIKKLFNSNKQPEIKDLLNKHRIEWSFICPRAPWHGGFYERLVGSVKVALAKTLGRSLVSFEELRTIISEVAAIINERPLSYISADPDMPRALTPAHFIRGGPLATSLCSVVPLDKLGPNGALPVGELRTALIEKTNYYRSLSIRWYREYLLQLRTANRGEDGKPRPLQVGDVCLLKDDNRPRIKWELVRVEEAHHGRDNVARTYTVQFSNGNRSKRAVQLLYPLEIV